MRLDVLLHELRLFKSRTQANEAIGRGDVLVGGRAAKASRDMHAGDRITLIGPKGRRDLELLDLPRASLRKDEARALVRDLPAGSEGR